MKEATKSKSVLNQIEQQRHHIETIIKTLAQPDILQAMCKEIEQIHQLFKKQGISLLGRQIQELRFRQCNAKTQKEKNELARELVLKVAQLRTQKKQIHSDIKEKGKALTQLYEMFFTSIHLGYLKKEYEILIDLIDQLVTIDSCMLYKGIDESDAAGIVEVKPFFHKMLILALFSTPALLQAYAGKMLKSKSTGSNE